MKRTTAISWTDHSWNPVTGCSHVSEGCRHCYAETLSLRRGWSKVPWTANNAAQNVTLHPDRLWKPYTIQTPQLIFTCSMSDLFHELVPDGFLRQVFDVMANCTQHTFQVLTKRPERAAAWPGPWPPNVLMGTSVEDRRVIHRLDILRQCPAQTRWISFEPLIGPVGQVDLTGFHWAVVGGESGPGYRPMNMAWAREIRDQCVVSGVAFFFKQDSGPRAEMRPWLIEENGSQWEWRQFPGMLTPPQRLR